MTLEDLGNLGELVGAVGVIVTLAYLAVQMRSNAAAVRAQTRSNITGQILHLNTTLMSDSRIRETLGKARAGEPLTDADDTLLRGEAMSWFRHMENVQYQYESGLYDADEYEAERAMWIVRFGSTPHWRETWHDMAARGVFSHRLKTAVEPIVRQARADAGG